MGAGNGFVAGLVADVHHGGEFFSGGECLNDVGVVVRFELEFLGTGVNGEAPTATGHPRFSDNSTAELFEHII